MNFLFCLNSVRSRCFILPFAFLMVLIAPAVPLAAADESSFVSHGIPVPVSRANGAVATVDENGTPLFLVWVSGQLVVINVEDGTHERHRASFTSGSPTYFLLSKDNRLYSIFGHHFSEFNVNERRFTHTQPVEDRFANSITEGDDGIIYFATYPNCRLYAFDPHADQLTDFGPMNDEDWPQYPQYVATDDAGWVYIGVGQVRGQLIAFHPPTGTHRHLLDEPARPEGNSVLTYRADDGRVYARPSKSTGWFQLREGRMQSIDGEPAARRTAYRAGWSQVVLGDFPDGHQLVELNLADRWISVRSPDGGQIKRIRFDYESDGARIYSLVVGHDGRIYGASGHPLRFFAFDPETNTSEHWGFGGREGHINTLIPYRNALLGAQYGGGLLHLIDPPDNWQQDPNTILNFREMGRAHPTINRPHAMILHPDQRHVIMTGTPGYGLTGGGMLIYDLENDRVDQLIEHDDLIPLQSTLSLIALPDGDLLGGTTTQPGTGGKTLARQAEVYLFDWDKRKVVFHAPILSDVQEIRDMILGPDGLVYGLAGSAINEPAELFVFDPEARTLLHHESVRQYGPVHGQQGPRILTIGPDSRIYALFRDAIVSIEPGSFRHQKIATPPTAIHVGPIIHGGRLYFAHESQLWSFAIPD